MTERRSQPRPKLTAAQAGDHMGLAAVERALAQIMAARHPGTTWVSGQHGTGDPATGQTIRRTLTRPTDDTAIPDGNHVVRRAA